MSECEAENEGDERLQVTRGRKIDGVVNVTKLFGRKKVLALT